MQIRKGEYSGSLRIPANTKPAEYALTIELKPQRGRSVRLLSKAKITVLDESFPIVGITTADRSGIVFGLHNVRLGGPYLTELAQGIRLEVIGRDGDNYKVKLSKSLIGWINKASLRILESGTPVPRGYSTTCSIDGDANFEALVIDAGDDVAYAVTAETRPENRLYLDLFNTHFANTWITQKASARLIGPVTGEQVEEDWVRMTVPIKSKQIWGYWVEKAGNSLTLYVKRSPNIAGSPDSPVRGLLFAIEAGHGGDNNNGALGIMGTKERNINVAAVQAIKKLLEARGAETILIRPGDSFPTLQERVETANNANADFYLSIHANAAGSNRGFLRVSGTSTYYKDKPGYLPAKLVYDKMLTLGWREFGCVGNFHYYPLRNTRIPGILVEQAFMSNPFDEARLLDPKYQEQQATAIVAGLEEFLNRVRE
jgi:N-acetylmuramoyl-L-alanine amidase